MRRNPRAISSQKPPNKAVQERHYRSSIFGWRYNQTTPTALLRSATGKMQASSQHEESLTGARRSLVQRIVASPGFSRSPRLAEFLTYICERALDGRADEISEQQIGVHVFKRAANYNPNDDSIVRSHARLLRQKLDAYFEQDGRLEEIRVHIPKGRYVPCFEPLETKPGSASGWEPAPVRIAKASPRRGWAWAAFSVLALGAVLAFVLRVGWPGQKARPTPHAFWADFFSSGKKVLVVPADSALALIEDITHRQISLTDYLSHRYRFDLVNVPGWTETDLSRLATRQYTSMADLNLTARLVRLPEAGTHAIEIRYARNLQLSDLKEGSAVLIGGPRANPWEDLFQDKMNFFVDTDLVTLENRVTNKVPRPGEKKIYGEPQADSPVRAYGLVALLPGLRASTRTLVVEGTSSTGTECAADFLLDDSALGNFIAEISKGSESSSGNTLPFFEVVLQSAAVAGSAQQPQIVAYRIIKN